MEIYFSFVMLLIYSVLFGSTMKLADLFNEHGFKWFKGDGIFFGFLFGIFGGLLIFSGPGLANLWLALLLANILRFRVDRFNHGIAAVLMFIGFLLAREYFDWYLFLYFFITFAFFGLAMDLNIFINKDNPLYRLLEMRLFYFIITFAFSIYTGIWIVFFSMSLFQISYNITSRWAKKSRHYIA